MKAPDRIANHNADVLAGRRTAPLVATTAWRGTRCDQCGTPFQPGEYAALYGSGASLCGRCVNIAAIIEEKRP